MLSGNARRRLFQYPFSLACQDRSLWRWSGSFGIADVPRAFPAPIAWVAAFVAPSPNWWLDDPASPLGKRFSTAY
jgi:hypothetical protein